MRADSKPTDLHDETLGAQVQPASGTLVLSASKVRDYASCRRRFFLSHILRVPGEDKDSDASFLGRCIHRELFVRHDVPEGDCTIHDSGAVVAEDIPNDPAIVRAARAHGAVCPSHTGATYLGGEVDLRWLMRSKNILLTGRADALWRHSDGTYEVRDYKTGSARGPEKLENDVAALVYALLVVATFPDARRVRVTYEHLGQQSVDHVSIVSMDVTSESLRRTIFQLQDLSVAIRKERSFHASPDEAVCSPCVYAEICPARMAGRFPRKPEFDAH